MVAQIVRSAARQFRYRPAEHLVRVIRTLQRQVRQGAEEETILRRRTDPDVLSERHGHHVRNGSMRRDFRVFGGTSSRDL